MANNFSTLAGLFTAIADAIRGKTGGTDSIVADTFPTAIDAITTLSDGTADATATAEKIFEGETAYVSGEKVTGSFSIDDELTTQDAKIAELQAALEGKAGVSGGSGGASVETCEVTLTITNNGFGSDSHTLYYSSVDSSGTITATTTSIESDSSASKTTTFTMVYNSYLIIYGSQMGINGSGFEEIECRNAYSIIKPTANTATIEWTYEGG